jgi:hypothetical protein
MDNIGLKAADVNLDDLADRVRSEVQAVRSAGAALLHHAMAAGDALIESQKRVTQNWKYWLKENCLLSVRTAMVYVQLARHRAKIEPEIERNSHLSLRAALKLIAAPASGPTKPRSSTLLSIVAWQAATAEQRQEYLAAIGLVSFLAAIPPAWHADLKRRVDGVSARASAPISNVIGKALRQALSAQKISQKAKTCRPSASLMP